MIMAGMRPGIMRKGDKRRGSVLVVVLVIILTMLVLGSLFLRLMGTETIMADNLESRTRAIYLAESGVHVGIVFLQDNPNWPVELPTGPETLTLAGGSFSYGIGTTSLPNEASVESTGTLGTSERRLEVRVAR